MRNSRGFSLVEVLVAASILALCLLAVLGLFSTAYSNVGDGGRRTKAVALAKQKMEQLRDGIFPPTTLGSPETVDTIYTRSWTVVESGPSAKVARIDVTVAWPDPGRGTKQLTFTSMVAP
jgi:prepilin-type N-terminal cleavage/methylation domain-containing protein